jgi:hypothetical protein
MAFYYMPGSTEENHKEISTTVFSLGSPEHKA